MGGCPQLGINVRPVTHWCLYRHQLPGVTYDGSLCHQYCYFPFRWNMSVRSALRGVPRSVLGINAARSAERSRVRERCVRFAEFAQTLRLQSSRTQEFANAGVRERRSSRTQNAEFANAEFANVWHAVRNKNQILILRVRQRISPGL